MRLRIGTRGSDLALWQARHVARHLGEVGCEVELVVLKTRGDRIDHAPLHTLEGKAFFTAEIETALLEHRVDLAVHSHKDLPVEGPPGLEIVAIPARAHPGERLLVSPEAYDADALFLPLATASTVGTSAPRRTEQLLTLRPDLDVTPLRGNVPTRVRRLQEGQYDAILLAAAGLDRLALETNGLIAVELDTSLLVPAPAQGALAVQTRAADTALIKLIRESLEDTAARASVRAERSLLVEAGGGCNVPLGCIVTPISEDGGGWEARAFLGANYPTEGAPPRWASARGAEPDLAVRRVWESLNAGSSTTCGPLAGQRVSITGASDGGTRLGERLETLGAFVVHERVLSFEDADGPAPRPRVASLSAGDGLAVTSKEAARRLAPVDVPPGVIVGAVGPSTERELRRSGIEVDHVGAGGARELSQSLPVRPGQRVLFPCAEDALPDLQGGLEDRGVRVERLPLYRTVPVEPIELRTDVTARVYMSPSAVEACAGPERELGECSIARIGIGRTTAATLEKHGLARGTASSDGLEASEGREASEDTIRRLARLHRGSEVRP